VSACTWLPHAVTLLQFAVPTFGRLPLVTPVAVYPAICVATAIAIVPPLVALLASVIRPVPLARSRGGRALDALVVSSLAVGVAASFASAYLAEAYTFERPLVRTALYVADHVKNGAAWETGANEPGLPMLTFHAGMRPGDLPAPVFAWRPADSTAPPVPGLPIPPLPMPFRFRAPADVAAAPADASGRWLAGDGRLDVEITVQLRQDRLLAAVLLPPGTTPIGAAPPGEFQRGWWTTARAAAPSGPVTFRLTLPPGA